MVSRIVGLLAALAGLALVGASGAAAERRIALIIGNDAYQNLQPLRKAVADALSYAEVLREKGFDKVLVETDLTRSDMDIAIASFLDEIGPDDTALFAYSGHGWSDGAQNYLVGIDAPKSGSQELLARVSIALKNGTDGVIDDMDRKGAALKVAIIDACRDNPFTPASGKRGVGLSRGLVRVEPPGGTFIVFSAGAGQTALDRLSDADDDPNSVFTRVFLPQLRADVTLQDAIKTTQQQVVALARSINEKQQPAYYDEVLGKACLSGSCVGAGPPPVSLPAADASQPLLTLSLDDEVNGVAFSPDGTLLATAGGDHGVSDPDKRTGTVQLFDATNGAPVRTIENALACSFVAFSPDGSRLLTQCEKGTEIWRLASEEPSSTLEWSIAFPAFSPDGNTVLTSRGEKLSMWAVDDGSPIRDIEVAEWEKSLRAFALSPDGNFSATNADDGLVKIWSMETGQVVDTIDISRAILSVAFSPDGRYLLVVHPEVFTTVWEIGSAELRHKFAGHADEVWTAAFSPDGRLIATGSWDKTAKIWDAETGELLRTLAGHSDHVHSVAFAPDGRLATGSWDGTVKVWDLGDLLGGAGIAGK